MCGSKLQAWVNSELHTRLVSKFPLTWLRSLYPAPLRLAVPKVSVFLADTILSSRVAVRCWHIINICLVFVPSSWHKSFKSPWNLLSGEDAFGTLLRWLWSDKPLVSFRMGPERPTLWLEGWNSWPHPWVSGEERRAGESVNHHWSMI